MPLAAIKQTPSAGPSLVVASTAGDASVDIASYPTWASWKKGLRDRTHKPTRDRFTVVKATQFLAYAERTPAWRQLAVVVLTPVPSLLASLLAPLIPLQDPTLGVLQNDGFVLHSIVTITLTVFGAMVQARAAVGLTHAEYTTLDIALIALLSSLHLIAILSFAGYAWRFPVPFSWALSFAPWMLCLVWSHVVVLRGRLRSPNLRNRLLFYLPSLAAQVSQVVVYPVYSAVFEAVGPYGQVALIGFFPLLKRMLKSQILLVSHHLGDYAREVAVCSVEISASMYQAMIMANAPTLLSSVLVIGLDVGQGLLDIRHFVEHDSVVPNHEILPAACRLLQDGSTTAFPESELTKCGTRKRRPWRATRRLCSSTTRVIAAAERPSKPATTSAKTELLVVIHALEILQAAESILLVEYLEVAVPVANTVFLMVATQLPSAVFNPKLVHFYENAAALHHAVVSIFTYMSLQAATLLVMVVVIRVRYRVSALALLGFALESQAWSMQGKMIAWLPVIFAFSVVHYGIDFTFQFDFRVPPLHV